VVGYAGHAVIDTSKIIRHKPEPITITAWAAQPSTQKR